MTGFRPHQTNVLGFARGCRPSRNCGAISRPSMACLCPTWNRSMRRSPDSGAPPKIRSVGKAPRRGSKSVSSGPNQALAKRFWSLSGNRVNPRYLKGPGIVADRYDLTDAADGNWTVTEAGRDLLASTFGATERGIDLQEGMAELLKLIQIKPNARRGDLLPGWRDFVVSHSNVRQESVVKHFLYNRLQSLLDRKLIERDGQRYRLIQAGEDYLGLVDVGTARCGSEPGQGIARHGRDIQPFPAGHAARAARQHGPLCIRAAHLRPADRDGIRGRRSHGTRATTRAST